MTDRRRIEEKIKKKEAEIQALEEQLRASRGYLQALQDVLKMFPKSPENVADTSLRPGSLVAQARDVIRANGAPMHVDAILAVLGKDPSRSNKTALGGSISAYVRKGEIFTRPGPNTFGLIDFQHRITHTNEPPADFGRDAPASEKNDDDIPF